MFIIYILLFGCRVKLFSSSSSSIHMMVVMHIENVETTAASAWWISLQTDKSMLMPLKCVPREQHRTHAHAHRQTTSGVAQPKNIHFEFNTFPYNYFILCIVRGAKSSRTRKTSINCFKQHGKVMIFLFIIGVIHPFAAILNCFICIFCHCRTQNMRWTGAREVRRDFWEN